MTEIPHLYPNARLIVRIEQMDGCVYRLAGGAGASRGTGRMKTKLQTTGLAASLGIE